MKKDLLRPLKPQDGIGALVEQQVQHRQARSEAESFAEYLPVRASQAHVGQNRIRPLGVDRVAEIEKRRGGNSL